LIVLDQIAKTHLLHQQLAKEFPFPLHFGTTKLSLTLQHVQVMMSVAWKSLPANILFILRDNVHGHEDIQGVIDPPAFSKDFLDKLIGDFVLCGFALFFDLAADFYAKVVESRVCLVSCCSLGQGTFLLGSMSLSIFVIFTCCSS
jgi:hypothetical protein